MATNANANWKVREHGPLERLADNLWRVTGALPGMSLKRVMTVARRSDGSILIHSAIAMNEAGMRDLEALGPLAVMIVPNRGHRLDAPAYKQRYPNLEVYCPRGGREAIAAMVPVVGTFENFPADDTVRIETLSGIAEGEGAMIVRSLDGLTVVLNDVVMNMDRKRDLLGFFFTTLLGSAPGPRVSRFARLVYVKDQSALRADLERLAALPNLKRLLVSHEKVASGEDAAAALRQAAKFLKKPKADAGRNVVAHQR